MENTGLNVQDIRDAQGDMRTGYGNGSVGVFVSGAVWIVSSLILHSYSAQQGIWTLIIGGMLIFPLSTLIGKLIGLKGAHDKTNPLAKLAMEGTIWMIVCIPLAYGLASLKAEWFFQGMLLIIGGRYLTFASIYGLRIYWVLGAVLVLAAYALFRAGAGAFASALTGGLIEIISGTVIYARYKTSRRDQTAENSTKR